MNFCREDTDMMPYKPVSVPRGGFAFCRYGVAALLWVGYIWRLEWVIMLATGILAASAALGVGRAPMILLYKWTVEKIRPGRQEVLDEYGMRFAHALGTVLLGIGLLLLHYGPPQMGWTFLFWIAAFKTIGALGFCAASCMYNTLFHGSSCCSFLNRKQCEIPAETEPKTTDQAS